MTTIMTSYNEIHGSQEWLGAHKMIITNALTWLLSKKVNCPFLLLIGTKIISGATNSKRIMKSEYEVNGY